MPLSDLNVTAVAQSAVMIMECSRCEQVMSMEDAELSTKTTQILPGIEGILCRTCGLCVGLLYAEAWVTIKECLSSSSQRDGWILADGLWDKAIHWVLAQVVYRLWEPPNEERNEALFDTPDPTDIVYLLWVGGVAVGFCTLKPKGAEIEGAGELYAMVTVDTVFVRSSYRRRGHVYALLTAIAEAHSDVGFSLPISDSMAKVLRKFLSEKKEYRRCTWEISGGGNEGCRKLLWYTLRKRHDGRDARI